MECYKNARRERDNWSKEDEKIYKHLQYSYQTFRDKPLIRLLMTGSGRGGSTSVKEWKSWAENILGSSLDDVSLADAQWVEAQTRNLVDASKRAVFKDGASLKEWMVKAALLPGDLFNYHGLGSVFERISESDQIRAERRANLGQKINVLRKNLNEIAGTSVNEASKIFNEANSAVENARAEFEIAKKKGDKGDIEVKRRAFDQATEKFENLTGDRVGANKSARVIRLIAQTLDGQITENQLRAKLGSDATFGTVKRVIENTRSLMKEFEGLLADSSIKFRDMLKNELEARLPSDEALELANKITQFTPEESYYPNRNLLSLYQRVEGVLKAQDIISKNPPGESFVEQINALVGNQRTAHAKHRKQKSTLIDYNMLDVLDVYGKQVYDHAHAARVAHIATTFERRLMDLDVIKNAAGKNTEEVMYANSVRKLLMAEMNQIFNRPAATMADNALATISSFQVFSKLTNPSTTINNRLEGVLQYIARTGLHRQKKVRQLIKDHEKVIAEAMEKAHTDFAVEDLTDASWNPASNENLRKMLAKHDLVDAQTLAKLEVDGHISTMRRYMRKIAGKGMSAVLWEASENANRREAFMMGAAEAADFVTTKWKDRFLSGEWTNFLVENYDLNRDLVNKAKNAKDNQTKRDFRNELFNEFRNKYIMRQGYRSMFQTQFQYSESARNFMDLNAKTSWITMFQHYPRSLASTIMWAMNDVRSLYKTGGLSGLRGEITARKFGDNREGMMGKMMDNLSINHRLNHVVTLGGISVLRQLIRSTTGIALFNILSHPLAEIASDLYAYFVDDEPVSKRDKAWELLYGRDQPIRRITGPLVGTVLDAASVPAKEFLQAMDGIGMASIEAGIRDGSLASYLSDTLGAVGLRPSERALTDKGRKDYNSALEVAQDYALHSFAIYGKGQKWIDSLLSKNPYSIMLETGNMAGIRPDWKVINEERDRQRAKDYKI